MVDSVGGSAWGRGRCGRLYCEVYDVRTATGPGGRAGPLRIDLASQWGHHPVQAHHSCYRWPLLNPVANSVIDCNGWDRYEV